MAVKFEKLSKEMFLVRLRPWKVAVRSVLKGNITIWQKLDKPETLRVLNCNPLFGYGFGNFAMVFPHYPPNPGFNTGEKFSHAHNDYIEALFDLGIIGVVFLLLLLGSLLQRFRRVVKNKEFVVISLCLLGYLLGAFVYFSSHMPVSGMLLMIFYGLFESIRRENGAFAVNSKG
jgi:O-antigen ligase